MQSICAISLTDVRNDLRVRKEADSAAANYRVSVVSNIQDYDGPNPFECDRFEVHRIRLLSKGLPRSPAFWIIKYIEFVIRSSWRAWRLNADLYHGHENRGALPAWIAARLRGRPFVYDAHELEADRKAAVQRTPWLHKALMAMIRFLLRRADAVICANESRAKIMVQDYGLTDAPTPLMNVAPKAGLPVGEPPQDWRPPDRPAKRVLYQGVLARGRGLMNVIRAFKELPDEYHLTVVGSGEREADLKRLCSELQLESRIQFVGRVPADTLVHYMRASDLGLAIYRNTCRNNYYCAPNKVYEYASVGLPVIGPDFPEMQTLIERFELGRAFDPEDASSIARAVRSILDHPEQATRMGQLALQLKEHVNWEGESRKLCALYARLLTTATHKPAESPHASR